MDMNIRFTGNRGFTTEIRGHEVKMDLPEKMGGGDTAPTPTEHFIASIGACAGLYAARYMQTAGLNAEGLTVKVDWDFAEDRKRVERIYMSISAPKAVLGGRKKALLAAAGKCVIHNTLKDHPDLKIDIEGE